MRRAAATAVLVAAAAVLAPQLIGGQTRTGHEAHASGPVLELTLGRAAQRFTGWGASVVTETRVDPIADPALSAEGRELIDRLVFGEAGVRLLRIWSPGAGFGTADGRVSADDGRFALMRRARRRGVRFLLTGADAPAAMKDGNKLRYGWERRYARTLARILAMAEKDGVPFSGVAVGNEVDNEKMPLTMTEPQAGAVAAELARQIARRRLSARIVAGDNLGYQQAHRYAREQLRPRAVRRAAAAVASHAYGGEAADREALARLARAAGLPVWMTEWTIGCPEGSCPDNPTISFALLRGEQIVRDLTEADASAWFLFRPVTDTSHAADDGLLVRDAAGAVHVTKRLWVFRQFTWAARPGVRVHPLRGGAGRIAAVGFTGRHRQAVVLVNRSEQPAEVRLDLGTSGGSLQARRTSEGEDFAPVDAGVRDGGMLATTLPSMSVTTLVLR